MVFSALLIILSIASFIVKGLNWGIDFSNGYIAQLQYDKDVNISQLKLDLKNNGVHDSVIQGESMTLVKICGNQTPEDVIAAADAGADLVEIGIPFSDPQADGPVIQASSQLALDKGITLKMIFEQAQEIRTRTDVPIALMGYYNSILKMGHDSFLDHCVLAGVDGVILPDLP